ncbi:hypothetical protein TIFTF001_014782 [Ficus carica]|uniref:Transcription initiation factor TFIID subunit 10 n=1 Tax=Ficus carica TaxID=3494 RepID=A0AA88A3D5_FICCA|nr:hypothetical protein TIFTF001_014782 [Ficus carica]
MNHNQQSGDGRHDDDTALSEFLASLMDYTPTIPDELVEHYLAKSGFQCPDVRLIRLVAVATQKFVAEVATDALQIWFLNFNEQMSSYDMINRKEGVIDHLGPNFIADALNLKSVFGRREKWKGGEGWFVGMRQECKARQASIVKDKRDKQQKDKRLILTMEDLSKALREHGVNVKHQEYFADNPSTGMDPASRDE